MAEHARQIMRTAFEALLDDLVASMQFKGMDLLDIAAVLELKLYTVNEAAAEE